MWARLTTRPSCVAELDEPGRAACEQASPRGDIGVDGAVPYPLMGDRSGLAVREQRNGSSSSFCFGETCGGRSCVAWPWGDASGAGGDDDEAAPPRRRVRYGCCRGGESWLCATWWRLRLDLYRGCLGASWVGVSSEQIGKRAWGAPRERVLLGIVWWSAGRSQGVGLNAIFGESTH